MKKLSLLFALLCASVMGMRAEVAGSSQEHCDGNAFVNAYDYSFSTNGTDVTLSFTNNDNVSGLVGILWHFNPGLTEKSMTVSGNTASITLTDQTPGETIEFACKFAFAADANHPQGMSVTKHFTYTVEGGSVDPNAPHASGKGFGTYIAKNVPFYTRVDNKADETKDPLGTVDLYIITYGNKIMGKAKLNNAVTFQGAGYSMQFRIWNDAQTNFNEQWAQLREANTTVALIDMNSNYCNLNQGTRTELPMNTYMETSANTGAVPMFTYTLDYINAPIAGDETAPVISSAVASYSPITGQPAIVVTATDANDMFYKVVDPSNNVSYSFSNTIQLTTDESNNVLTYTVYAIDYNGNVSSSESVNVQMKPALSNIASGKTVTAVINPSTTGRIVDGNFNGDRWSSAGAIHYDPVNHPDDYQDWFYINFVNIYDLSAVRIKWETARPNNYTFRTSIDGTNWTTVASFTEYPTANAIVDYVLPANTQGRFFGVWATSGYDNLNWGISPFEVEVYGAQAVIEDHNPPTLNSAVLSGDPEWNQVRIAVEAEDAEDPEIYVYHVVDTDHSIDQECMVSAGVITVTGLSGETTYNFSVKAVDGAGNESDAIVVNATTPIDTSVPLVAAPTPDGTSKEIRPIYSDAFASILAHSFDKDGWGGVSLMEEKDINGDKCLVYNIASANEVIWGMYDNGNNAIIAADGYHSATGMGIDASAMTHLHLDIWSLQACNNCINININDAALKTLRLSHAGSGWQSYDIDLSEFQEGAEGKKIDNVRWMKFNGIGPISGKMALDNVYFWAPASGMKSVSASSNNATMGSAVVKQGDDEVTSVAEGSEVSFIATANEGYVFVNWTNLGTVVSTNATYVTTITETTNLVANFDYIRTTYCQTLVQANNNDRQVYVTVRSTGEVSNEKPVYRIEFTGVADNAITGIANFNVAINNVTAVTDWVVETNDAYPYGHIYRDYAAANWRNITFNAHHFNFNAATQGFYIEGNFALWINWDNECEDEIDPVLVKAETEVLNETSVRLTLKATDNWNGGLTYTISRAGADDIVLHGASGEELTQDVTGLTTGTEYTFTVLVQDAAGNNDIKPIVITPVGDETKPVMGEASLASKTWNSAIINVAATDNKGVTAYYVVEKAADYVATEGKITIEGLTAATAYTFNIKAKDAAGNISDNQAEVSFTTDAHSLVPTTAAPVPTWPAAQVISFYSDSYSEPTTWNYRAGWGGNTAYEQVEIAENNVIHYSNFDWVGWVINSGEPYNALTMEKLHLDIWVENDCVIGIVPIYGGSGLDTDDNKRVKPTLHGQQWNSIDLDLATDYAGLNLSSIFQFKFDQATTNEFYLDNVYFYRESALEDSEAPENVYGSMALQSYYSVTLTLTATDDNGAVNYVIKNGDTQVASTAGASGASVNVKVENLTPGTEYAFNVIAKDGSDNEADAIIVNATTLAAPASAPVPTYPAGMVMSLYSDAYAPVVNVANYCEWWWESPTVHTNHTLGEGDHVLFYDNNHQAGASFGWSWSGDNKINFTNYQKLHLSVYPSTDGTIEIYPVVQPEAQFHKVSQTLVAGQWNDIVLDYTDKTFAPLNQIGFINFYDLGEFFVDNVYFYAEAEDFEFADDADNAAIVAENDKKWVNAKINRNLLANGEWFTLCLPFDMNDAQLVDAFGAGYTLTTMTGAEDRGSLIHLNFENVYALEAGKPYLIRPAQDFSAGDVIETVMIKNVDPAALKSANQYMEFQGTFSTITLNQDNQRFVGPENYLYSPAAAGTSMKSFRCYFTIPAGPQQNNVMGKRARIVFGPQTTTDFENVQGDNVQSTKVIRDGQLFIIRDNRTFNAQGQLVK